LRKMHSGQARPTKLLVFAVLSALGLSAIAILTHTDQKPHLLSLPVDVEKLVEEEEARIAGTHNQVAELGSASTPFNIQVNQEQSVLSAIPAPAWAVLGVVLGSHVTGVLALWQKRLDRVHTHSQWMNENRMKGQIGLDEDPRSLESTRHSAPAIQR